MKKLIIYDLDGTLADTRRDICLAANFMVTQLGGQALPDEEIASYVGSGLNYLVGGCLKTDDRKAIERAGKIYRDYYAKHMMDHTKLYPDARVFLDYFKDRKQAVITNKPDPFSRQMIRELGAEDYFFEIIPGNSDYPKKPNPSAVLQLMKASSALPGECLLIGDSGIDIETARNAGIETAAISHGFIDEDRLKSLKPDHLASDFKGLMEIARSMKW